MIQDKIKELKKINKIIDIEQTVLFHQMSHELEINLLKSKRDQLISELEEELVKLDDFDNWKEWKNSVYLKYENFR
jgi:hypothetical protein